VWVCFFIFFFVGPGGRPGPGGISCFFLTCVVVGSSKKKEFHFILFGGGC